MRFGRKHAADIFIMRKEKVKFFGDSGIVLKGIFNYEDYNCDNIMHAVIFFKHGNRNLQFVEFCGGVKPIRTGGLNDERKLE